MGAKNCNVKCVSIKKIDIEKRTLDTASLQSGSSQANAEGISDITLLVPEPAKKRWFFLELPMLLNAYAFSLSGGVYSKLLLYQTCSAVYHYNRSDCQPILDQTNSTNTTQHIKYEIQLYVSNIQLTNTLISAIIPALVVLFIGPWTDRYGRRPVILVTFTASVIGHVIAFILATLSTTVEYNPWINMISLLPLSFVGGNCAMMTMVFCYISDDAPPEDKVMRIYINFSAIGIGTLLGGVTTDHIYIATVLSTFFSLLSLIYVIFYCKESLKPEHIQSPPKLREVFRLDSIVDIVRTALARRHNFNCPIIWVIVPFIITNFIIEGENQVFVLFTYEKFDVADGAHTTYGIISSVIQIVGGTVVLQVLIFRFSIVSITMIALALCTFKSIVFAAAAYWWEMYFGAAFSVFGKISSALMLSIIATFMPSTEVGKIFALTTASQAIALLGADPAYIAIYDATLSFYPGLYNIISSILCFICFVLIALIFHKQSNNAAYDVRSQSSEFVD